MTLYRIDAWGTENVDIDFDCDSPEQAAELFITQEWKEQPLSYADYELTIYSLKDMDCFYENDWENDRYHGWDCFDECGKYIATLKPLVTVKKNLMFLLKDR